MRGRAFDARTHALRIKGLSRRREKAKSCAKVALLFRDSIRRHDMSRLDGSSLWFRLSLCFLLLGQALRVASGEAFTFSRRPGSYAEYEQWRTSQDGLAKFDFLTSQADAMLFYLESNINGMNYLLLWLEEGRMRARVRVGDPATTLEATFGNHLNDLSRHSVLVKHSQNTFQFHLGRQKVAEIRYEVPLLFQTGSNVFIGGLPASLSPASVQAAALQPFAGCVEEVRFADDSTELIKLRARPTVATSGLQEGCLNSCSDDDGGARCNGGECVRSWAAGDEGFMCDCSQTASVGPRCTRRELREGERERERGIERERDFEIFFCVCVCVCVRERERERERMSERAFSN